jgi:hypothetical protein
MHALVASLSGPVSDSSCPITTAAEVSALKQAPTAARVAGLVEAPAEPSMEMSCERPPAAFSAQSTSFAGSSARNASGLACGSVVTGASGCGVAVASGVSVASGAAAVLHAASEKAAAMIMAARTVRRVRDTGWSTPARTLGGIFRQHRTYRIRCYRSMRK